MSLLAKADKKVILRLTMDTWAAMAEGIAVYLEEVSFSQTHLQ